MGIRIRTDALSPNAAIFFERQLEHIFPEVLREKVPERNVFRLMNIGTSIPVGAKTYTRRSFENIGRAKWVSNHAGDLPRVALAGEEDTYKTRTMGDQYEYSLEDIEAAALAGFGLSMELGVTARLAAEQLHNTTAFAGDEAWGLHGLTTFPFIPRFVFAEKFDSGASSNDALIRQVFDMLAAVEELTEDVARPTRIVYASLIWRFINSTPRTTTSDTTIAQYIAQTSSQNGQPVEQLSAHELNGAGPNGENLVWAYTPGDPRVQSYEIPGGLVFEQRPPQEKSLAFIVPCRGKSGGFFSSYPMEQVLGVEPLT